MATELLFTISPHALPLRSARGGGEVGIPKTAQSALPPSPTLISGGFPSSATKTPMSKREFAFDRNCTESPRFTVVPATHCVTPLVTATCAIATSLAEQPSVPVRVPAHMLVG